MNLFPIIGVRARDSLADGRLVLLETKLSDMPDFECRRGIATTLIWDANSVHPGTLILGPSSNRVGAYFDGEKHGRVVDLGDQWELEAVGALDEIDLSPNRHALPTAGTLMLDENGPVAISALFDRTSPCFYIFESKTLVRSPPRFSATLASWDIAMKRGDALHRIASVKAAAEK